MLRAGRKYGQSRQCSIFTNYHIDSAAENEIFLEFQVDYLLRALRSAQNAVDVMMKLTKKNGVPLLSLIMSHSSRGGKRLELVQDIPVKVLSPNQMASLKEPVCPLPQVYIMMPNLQNLQMVAERMKALSEHIIVSANMAGEFTIKVETDLVQVETFYHGLQNPELDTTQMDITDHPSVLHDKHAFASARVDTKSFVKFLYSHHVGPQNVICSIVEGYALIFYVYIGTVANEGEAGREPTALQKEQGLLTFYLPVRHE
ncbi:hypothetical protein BC937DRAFT_87159 [Endogone sp. FLAS-F59071]|nr:hypothetical protein BC937DRAFT_87159 [Endogone sp. FLAS-F59071]|eukprot:RUS19648.1 hypothetical protein BC937DRAFT_87159 [Endogone sp. FLAS-F59071]